MSNIVCFGEVLWDVFSNHRKVGGAPLNVALRLKSFQNNVAIISAIGNDTLGKELINYLNKNNLQTDYIQVIEDEKTGDVTVSLNDKGSASYTIEYPRAWDKIKLMESSVSIVKKADAFVFGSLITRNKTSKDTLYELLKFSKYSIFDLNLRPPFYSKEVLIDLMNKADFIKFNDEELYEVSDYLGSKYNGLEQNLDFIAQKTNTKHICVTKGPFGAVLLYNEKLYYNSGYKIKVADTVGAGDSFLASLISKLLKNENPQDAINFACAVGALVAKNSGANPFLELSEITKFISP